MHQAHVSEIRGADLKRFVELEQGQRPVDPLEHIDNVEQKERAAALPKLVQFFEYVRQRMQEEMGDIDRGEAADRIEKLILEVDIATQRYVAARVRHIRLADEMMQERETGRAVKGIKIGLEEADRARKAAHEVFMDSIGILGRNLRQQIARSREDDVSDITPISPEFIVLFDKENRTLLAKHATDYCWYLMSMKLGIPYVERV